MNRSSGRSLLELVEVPTMWHPRKVVRVWQTVAFFSPIDDVAYGDPPFAYFFSQWRLLTAHSELRKVFIMFGHRLMSA